MFKPITKRNASKKMNVILLRTCPNIMLTLSGIAIHPYSKYTASQAIPFGRKKMLCYVLFFFRALFLLPYIFFVYMEVVQHWIIYEFFSWYFLLVRLFESVQTRGCYGKWKRLHALKLKLLAWVRTIKIAKLSFSRGMCA